MPSARRLSLTLSLLFACKDQDPTFTDPFTTGADADSQPSLPTDAGDADAGDTTDTTGPLQEGENTVALAVSRDVDILFVIDNSGSMAEAQARLAAAFPALVDALDDPDEQINYRIGFTTTDAGNPRCLNTTPENGNLVLRSCLGGVDAGEFISQGTDFSTACTDFCALSDADLQILPTATANDPNKTPRSWLERHGQQTNFKGADLTDALRCYAPQGVAGCGFESHLEAMYKALALSQQKGSKTNYGFLREDSRLALVLVSDETDCSYNPEYKEIFTTNKTFWFDPETDVAPTSSMCWAAGVACDGEGPDYASCRAANYGADGQLDVSDDAAVLQPVDKYIDFVNDIEQKKQSIDADAQVLVTLLAGVPVGYESHAAELQYADAPDLEVQSLFGIGPGCTDDLGGLAVPPVREREFAEAFDIDPKARRNVHSICEGDYSTAMDDLGQRIRDNLRPSCMPNCVQDLDPSTAVLEPSCTVYAQNLFESTETTVPECVVEGDLWAPPAGETACFAYRLDPDGLTPSALDDMSPACVDDGYNLEFLVVRTADPPAGTVYSAACKLSPNKKKDCPKL